MFSSVHILDPTTVHCCYRGRNTPVYQARLLVPIYRYSSTAPETGLSTGEPLSHTGKSGIKCHAPLARVQRTIGVQIPADHSDDYLSITSSVLSAP